MATIEELEAQSAKRRDAEAAALRALGEAMRELAVLLPDGSGLALGFADTANTLDLHATGPTPASWGAVTVRQMVRRHYNGLTVC